MKKVKKTPVYFIATKTKQQPAVVNFYTESGEPVAYKAVKKVETNQGTQFYVPSSVGG